MSPKQTLPGQHLMLEQAWPNDCCLCTHEVVIGDLKRQLAEAQTKLFIYDARVIELRIQRGEAQGKLDAVREWSQGYADGKKASPVLVLGMRVAARAILRILKEEA